MSKPTDDRQKAREGRSTPRSAAGVPVSDIWRCRCGWSGSEPDEHPAHAAAYEPNRQLPAPLCPACGRYFMASEFPLDIVSIRRAAQEGLPTMPWQVLALCDRCEALEAALRPYAEQQSDIDNLLAARRLLGLPDFPPLDETLAALREAVGPHFDGVDPVAFVAELRGDDDEAAEARQS